MLPPCGNHDAAGAGFFGAQFGYDRPDVFGGGGKQDFVAFDDDGLRRGDDEAVVAVNGADLAVSTVESNLGRCRQCCVRQAARRAAPV